MANQRFRVSREIISLFPPPVLNLQESQFVCSGCHWCFGHCCWPVYPFPSSCWLLMVFVWRIILGWMGASLPERLLTALPNGLTWMTRGTKCWASKPLGGATHIAELPEDQARRYTCLALPCFCHPLSHESTPSIKQKHRNPCLQGLLPENLTPNPTWMTGVSLLHKSTGKSLWFTWSFADPYWLSVENE